MSCEFAWEIKNTARDYDYMFKGIDRRVEIFTREEFI